MIPSITPVASTDMSFEEEIIDVSPISELVIIHVLKDLIHGENYWQDIIFTSPSRKTLCKEIIKKFIPRFVGASTSQSHTHKNDNVATLSHMSRKVFKYGYDDVVIEEVFV